MKKRIIGLNNGFIRITVVICFLLLVAIVTFQILSNRKILRIGEMVPLKDCSLYVRDYGKGKPTIIIESGLNCSNNLYYNLQRKISKRARVISYNHAGIGALNYNENKYSSSYFLDEIFRKIKGASTPNSNPRTLPYYVKELREMMLSKELKPPFVFIGHSLGGHIIRYYTHLFPEEVKGLIFIDAPHEDWFSYVRETWNEDEVERYFNWWDPKVNSQKYRGIGLEELSSYETNCDLIRGINIPENIPVLMFTGNNKKHFRKDSLLQMADFEVWANQQYSFISKLKNKKQIVDKEAGHVFHNDKPDFVEKEINLFLDELK